MGDQPPARIRLEQHGGRTVVVKRATAVAAREALAAEAAVLQQVHHPGVIELVGFDAAGEASEMTTQYAGAMTLADYRPPDVASAAGVIAALAAVVADLHAIGLHHGRITADHVVLGPSRRPVLASLSQAAPATAEGRGADVHGVVDVLVALVERCPEPSSREARKHRRALDGAVSGWRTRAGGAGELASALAGLPFARLPEPDTASQPDPPRELACRDGAVDALASTRTWRHRVAPPDQTLPAATTWRRWAVPAGVVAVAFALTWWSAASGGAPQVRGTSPLEEPSIATPTPTAQVVMRGQRDVAPPFASCEDGTPRRGCDMDVEIVGHLVRVDGTWYAAGSEGDAVAVGDWDCDGSLTPAVLRPASGDVFVFDSWAATGDRLDIGPSWSAPGAVTLEAWSEGECDLLRSMAADGSLIDSRFVGLP